MAVDPELAGEQAPGPVLTVGDGFGIPAQVFLVLGLEPAHGLTSASAAFQDSGGRRACSGEAVDGRVELLHGQVGEQRMDVILQSLSLDFRDELREVFRVDGAHDGQLRCAVTSSVLIRFRR